MDDLCVQQCELFVVLKIKRYEDLTENTEISWLMILLSETLTVQQKYSRLKS